MLKRIEFFTVILLVNVLVLSGFSQIRNKPPQSRFQPETKIQKQIPIPEIEFENIINAIESRSVSTLSNYFSTQIYLSLHTGEKGYYSNNQTFYLLDKFFGLYLPISFQISSRVMTGYYPYISGKLFCKIRGSVQVFQIYISLNWAGSRWEITQITIN